MRSWYRVVLFLVLLWLLSASGRPGFAQSERVAFGLHVATAPDTFEELEYLENFMGRHVAIVHWFQDWASLGQLFPEELYACRDRGSVPMITWQPNDNYSNGNPFPLRDIAAGKFDNHVATWAKGLASYGFPVYLNFAQEMNANWFAWGYEKNTPEEFIAAWRHVHDVFVGYGATNVQWIWAPIWDNEAEAFRPISMFYPGDSYVDWLGMSVYNFGSHDGLGWRWFSDLFGPGYRRLQAINEEKPIMLTEWGTTEWDRENLEHGQIGTNGMKARWLREAAETILARFPRVRAAVYYSFFEAGLPMQLDSTYSALLGARDAFGRPGFGLTLPY